MIEGTLQVTRFDDPATLTTRLRIDHADPAVWITDELLAQIKMGMPDPALVAYDAASQAITIVGENLTVIYRLTNTYDSQRNCWLIVWPD